MKTFIRHSNACPFPSRRMRLMRFGNVAYRSDGYEDAFEQLDTKIKEYKASFENKFDPRLEAIEETIKELKAKGGRFTGGSTQVKSLREMFQRGIHSAIAEKATEIKACADPGVQMRPYEIKTVANIQSSNLTVDNFISYLPWRDAMEATGQFHFRNLVKTVISDTDYVQFPRANVPIGEGSFSRVAEAATKPQVDRDYTMVALTLTPMAAYAIVSRQAMRNIVFLQQWLPESLMNQMEESEDTDFANKLVAAATGSTTTTRTILVEKLVSYAKNLIKAKYTPNGIAVDPDVWEDIFMTGSGSAQAYALPKPVTIDANGFIRILNIPIYPVNWLTGRRIIVGDWTKAAIAQSEGVRLRTSDSHASLMTSNETLFLLERTENLVIWRPEAFITTTV